MQFPYAAQLHNQLMKIVSAIAWSMALLGQPVAIAAVMPLSRPALEAMASRIVIGEVTSITAREFPWNGSLRNYGVDIHYEVEIRVEKAEKGDAAQTLRGHARCAVFRQPPPPAPVVAPPTGLPCSYDMTKVTPGQRIRLYLVGDNVIAQYGIEMLSTETAVNAE